MLNNYKFIVHSEKVVSATKIVEYDSVFGIYIVLAILLILALFIANRCGNAPNAWAGMLSLTILMVILRQELNLLEKQNYPSLVISLFKENNSWTCFTKGPFQLKSFFGSGEIPDLDSRTLIFSVVDDVLYIPTKTSITLVNNINNLPNQVFCSDKEGFICSLPDLTVVAVDLDRFFLQEIVVPITVVEPSVFSILFFASHILMSYYTLCSAKDIFFFVLDYLEDPYFFIDHDRVSILYKCQVGYVILLHSWNQVAYLPDIWNLTFMNCIIADYWLCKHITLYLSYLQW